MVLLGCAEDDFPAGIYGYQVERLLTGGGEKVWTGLVNSTNCEDSTFLYIQLASSSNDSVTVAQLSNVPGCSSLDTLELGNASASFVSEGQLFTDSLVFASGDFWIINQITNTTLTVRQSGRITLSYIF